MKIYRWITAIIIFAIAGYCGYLCMGQLAAAPYCIFAMCLGCGVLVLLDGGRKCVHSK
jgi:hypothetical protein